MQDALHADELDGSWLASYDGVKVLSLDCFDTLLWRKVTSPTDVFFALAHSAVYQQFGLTAPLRAKAETAARRIKWVNSQCGEVDLNDIYSQALPGATDLELAALAAAELACEIDYCFAFKGVFELVMQAKALGMKVVVVSDTYLSQTQLRALLFAAMPPLEQLIDAVYCSNVYKLSKTDGIWRRLLPLLKVKPEQILHLGDNMEADYHSPQRFGIRATHFIQQRDSAAEVLRARAQVAVQLMPELGCQFPIPSYHHAQIACVHQRDPLAAFGYTSLGPILYCFADFVLREAAAIRAAGTRLKVAFLLRDGYLPGRACAELAGAPIGSALNISRLTSIAASLNSRERVVSLLSKSLSRAAFEALTRQLLLPGALADSILTRVAKSTQPEKDFMNLVLEPDTLRMIMAASQKFRERLVRHVRKATGVESGDCLMFVDLGYSGTAQTLLKDILKQDLNVELIGRYLLADKVASRQTDRKGLFDAGSSDPRIISALTGMYIAGFEMLCTQSAPSTVDYTEEGDPVFSGSVVGAAQQARVGVIQAACLRFIADVRDMPACHKPRPNERELAQSMVIDLARLLYFPTQAELDCMTDFQFDFNLGTDKKMALFDAAAGLRAMRTHGFGYMNADLDQMRTNYPWELRAIDLSLSVLMFGQNRCGFDIQPATASYRREKLQVMVTNASEHTVREVEASATYDGYFSLSVPLSSKFNVGILFGRHYSWIQIDSVQLISNGDLLRGTNMTPGEDVLFDQMTAADNGLFQVAEGALVYLPGLPGYGSKMQCRVIFRPIAWNAR
ncbi:HAD family hydrolase [Massilia sp. TSP1-1-2]|uniref:HAD family hydrolase n=1 Tax=Massilia sp. TSP1-1-2 TaxID=2804649 RepID=UPI003CF243C2